MPARARSWLSLKLVVLFAFAFAAGVVTTPVPAHAVDTLAAAGRANAGLNGCNSLAGKPLYECVAGILDRLAGDIGHPGTRDAALAADGRRRPARCRRQGTGIVRDCAMPIGDRCGDAAITGDRRRACAWLGPRRRPRPDRSRSRRAARLIQQKG